MAARLPPLAPGQARLYFYRDYEPYESLGRPNIRINGMAALISEPGGVSYRDLAAGSYVISVDNVGPSPGETRTLGLRSGETLYLKIESNRAFNEGFTSPGPDTFAVVPIDPAQAQREIATKRYFPAS